MGELTKNDIAPHPASTQDIVLLHGLWLGSWIMRPLRRRLEALGFRVFLFDYSSRKQTVQANAARLARFIVGLNLTGPVHLVTHSLGGLVALNMLSIHPQISVSRFVALGPPFAGSRVAQWFAGLPGGRELLGLSLTGALQGDGLGAVPAGVDIGVIAGNEGFGPATFLPSVDRPNDGTVAVSETALQGISARIELPLSHMGLILRSRALPPVTKFLDTGQFE